MAWLDYIINNSNQVLSLTLEHLKLTSIAVLIAVFVGVPLGIFISYYKKASNLVVGFANLVQAIPSMALLGLSIPLLGIGSLPAIVVVIIYSLLPIIKNTYTGITNINKETLEAAKAIGLTRSQVLTKVQIPLALPVIMAGVRISAVTAVGLMTMAAFIGAGGLGFLVFSGISTTNNSQIIAGAIPAAILALLVDLVFGYVEKLTTPLALQITEKNTKESLKSQRKKYKIFIGLVSGLIIVLLANGIFSGFSKKQESITIGGKDFTEQMIVVNLMADMVEDRTDLQVVRKANLGGTQVAFNALKSGDIDMYLEYTGTIYGDTLGYPASSDVEKVYQTSKKDLKEKFDIDTLSQFKFNNTYTLSVREDVAKEYNLETFSDLAKVADKLKIASSLEFLNRDDGLKGLQEYYGFKFLDEIGMNGSNRYLAIENKEVDAINAFATDGLLKKYNLKVLKDDKNFFPPYYAVPLLGSGVLEKHPELEEVMDELGSVLTDDVMMELNYRVDELQEQPAEVAHSFLLEQGLIGK